MFNRGAGWTGLARLPIFIFSVGVAGLLVPGCNRQEARVDAPSTPQAARPVIHSSSGFDTRVAPSSTFPSVAVDRPEVRLSGESSALTGDATVARETVSNLPVAPFKQVAPQPAPLPIPLAAVGYNPALKLNPRQVTQMVQMGQAFLAATAATPEAAPSSASVDTASASPAAAVSPAWIAAQEASDERFRAIFGYEAFNAQQILRYQQDHPAPQAVR